MVLVSQFRFEIQHRTQLIDFKILQLTPTKTTWKSKWVKLLAFGLHLLVYSGLVTASNWRTEMETRGAFDDLGDDN